MATKVVKTVFQFRRATTAEWLANKDVVPAAGEPCFDIELNILKIGDGKTTYENLEPIGGVKFEIAADGKSIVLEENTLKLMGFDKADVGAQPRKNAEGNIEWVVPSTETVDGLKSAVAGLQSDVKTIQEIVAPSGEGQKSLLEKIEENKAAIGVLNGGYDVEGSVIKTVKDEIDAFTNKVSEDGSINTIKELVDYVAEHGSDVNKMVDNIAGLQELVGGKSVSEQIDAAINKSGHLTKDEANATLLSKVAASKLFKEVKYEISHKPVGALVDYREKEIRVMCPVDTKWEKQTVGATGNANMYYMGFKAYAPEGAVGFKEGDRGVIVDEYFDFNGDFAGTDEFGRNYSICWLALASYDEKSDTWTYYGKNSSTKKYIGWDYVVEWYDADGVVIGSDHIRINLSNESCHNTLEPSYLANIVKEVAVNGTLMDIVNGKVDIKVSNIIKGSDEVEVAEDGTIKIKSISFDKITQAEDIIVVMDGGAAV